MKKIVHLLSYLFLRVVCLVLMLLPLRLAYVLARVGLGSVSCFPVYGARLSWKTCKLHLAGK